MTSEKTFRISSRRMLITLFVSLACALASFGKTYIVSVGVTDYTRFPGQPPNLNLTLNDATDISKVFGPQSPSSNVLLLNGNATRKQVLSAMEKVYSNAGKDDEIIFFFSGHGYPGGFCTYDRQLTYADIRKVMAKSPAKRKFIFADACHSGAIRVDARAASRHTDNAKKSDVMLFLASRNNETSGENRTMRNGYFTSWLVKGLKGDADVNHDRIVTARELFDFVQQGVLRSTRNKQHPVMWGNFSQSMPIIKH